MDWYYVINSERQGPVDDGKFNSLVESGIITNRTLIWNKTVTDWTAFGSIKSKREKAPEAETLSISRQSKSETIQKICSQCGSSFTEDELTTYKDFLICLSCKPVFRQKMREGVAIGQMKYAGCRIRLGAKIIDWIILCAISIAFSVLISTAAHNPENLKKIMAPGIILGLIQLLVSILYTTWFVGKFGATPGKMAWGLKITTPENDKISYLRAFGRFFAEIISGLIFFVGYIIAGFDSKKRALHDRICNTRVIKKG